MARATFQKVIEANAYQHDGMTVVYGKTNSVVTKVLGRTELAKKPATMLPKAPQARGVDLEFTFKPLSSGTFAYRTANKYIMRQISATISGVSNSVLRIGRANVGRRSNLYKENAVTLQLRAVTYDYTTGRPTSNLGTSRDQFGTDNEARSTRSAPGGLAYSAGRRRAVTTANYPARTD
jgi:hypothetical protein